MGGYGSGGHNRRRGYLEAQRRISVAFVRRRGLMRDGVATSMSWSDNWNNPMGTIQVLGGEDGVTLQYGVKQDGDTEFQHIEERVPFARVAKPFGGEQVYFRCPKCHRRVLELAMGGQRFRCRTCLGLVHASSQEGPVNRAMRQANKLKKKLGAELGLDSWYVRPRHMRRSTFERIDARIRAAEALVNDEHIRILGRLTRLSGRIRGARGADGCGSARKAFW